MSLKWRHAGQACITANRIYVQAGVYDRFAALLKERTAAIVVGHGAVTGTTMGPLTTPRSIDKASAQVEDARRLGADVILGGNPVASKPGYFFEPTILSGMTEEMLISQEESFAPIAALYRFETEEQAVKLANDTSMGLASYAFTKNIDRMWRLLENLEAGMIGMNTGKFLMNIPMITKSNKFAQATPRPPSRLSVVLRSLVMAKRVARTWLSMSTW